MSHTRARRNRVISKALTSPINELESRLLRQRKVLTFGAIDDKLARDVTGRLLALAADADADRRRRQLALQQCAIASGQAYVMDTGESRVSTSRTRADSIQSAPRARVTRHLPDCHFAVRGSSISRSM